MKTQTPQSEPLVLILSDNTALCFTATESEASEKIEEPETAPTPSEHIKNFFKSFMPKVSRVTPVPTRLPSGRRLNILAPTAIH